uniref:Uncharacterized protein n=1 Tax=Anguilla anguilla TaxID=7936 RepID=A0A0E9W6T2_ANGAN
MQCIPGHPSIVMTESGLTGYSFCKQGMTGSGKAEENTTEIRVASLLRKSITAPILK